MNLDRDVLKIINEMPIFDKKIERVNSKALGKVQNLEIHGESTTEHPHFHCGFEKNPNAYLKFYLPELPLDFANIGSNSNSQIIKQALTGKVIEQYSDKESNIVRARGYNIPYSDIAVALGVTIKYKNSGIPELPERLTVFEAMIVIWDFYYQNKPGSKTYTGRNKNIYKP